MLQRWITAANRNTNYIAFYCSDRVHGVKVDPGAKIGDSQSLDGVVARMHFNSVKAAAIQRLLAVQGHVAFPSDAEPACIQGRQGCGRLYLSNRWVEFNDGAIPTRIALLDGSPQGALVIGGLAVSVS